MTVPKTKTEVKALLAARGVRPARARGQHFLVDANLVEAIAREAGVGPRDCVLEVGTGTGILTHALAARAGCVVSCDVDGRLQEVTRGLIAWPPHVVFVVADILAGKHLLNAAVVGRWQEERAARGLSTLRVVANLPYS
ncbi:MAG: rRNA adenine N-6-methyltransferase family protein, partial [Planctomycetota bacterium]